MPERPIGKDRDGVDPVGAAVLEHDEVGQREFARLISPVVEHAFENLEQRTDDVFDVDPLPFARHVERVLVVATVELDRRHHAAPLLDCVAASRRRVRR